MIEILPFNKTLFNDFTIEDYKLSKYCYITNMFLASKLISMKLPIQNKKLALINIFDFLNWLDREMKERDSTLIQIPQNIFIDFFNRNEYKKYVNLLSELNILTNIPYEDEMIGKEKTYKLYSYENKIPKQYRIHNEYLNEDNLCILIIEQERRDKLQFINEIDSLDIKYQNTIKKLEIDVPRAIEAEIKNFIEKGLSINSLRIRISRIFYTRRKRFIKKGKKVNRIYHSFTNVSKVSRKHFNIYLHNVDIKNCQPLLLVMLLKSLGLKTDKNYQDDCENGIFYERFMDINRPINISDEEWRIKTKVSIYKNIFFGFIKRSKHNVRFNELYPNTYNSILELLENDSLASQLQNLESELFNNITPKESKYYFTLFDAIYFDSVLDLFIIEDKIKEYFLKYNIKVTTTRDE